MRFLRRLVRVCELIALVFVVLGIATQQWTAAVGDVGIFVVLALTNAGLLWAIRRRE